MNELATRKGAAVIAERRLTPKQELFLEYWLTPSTKTFGNAYKSAIRAGYSKKYASQITSEKRIDWLRDNHKIRGLDPMHVVKGVEQLAIEGKPDISLRAYIELGKFLGMYVDRSVQHIDVNFTNSVPRPHKVVAEQPNDLVEPLKDK